MRDKKLNSTGASGMTIPHVVEWRAQPLSIPVDKVRISSDSRCVLFLVLLELGNRIGLCPCVESRDFIGREPEFGTLLFGVVEEPVAVRTLGFQPHIESGFDRVY